MADPNLRSCIDDKHNPVATSQTNSNRTLTPVQRATCNDEYKSKIKKS